MDVSAVVEEQRRARLAWVTGPTVGPATADALCQRRLLKIRKQIQGSTAQACLTPPALPAWAQLPTRPKPIRDLQNLSDIPFMVKGHKAAKLDGRVAQLSRFPRRWSLRSKVGILLQTDRWWLQGRTRIGALTLPVPRGWGFYAGRWLRYAMAKAHKGLTIMPLSMKGRAVQGEITTDDSCMSGAAKLWVHKRALGSRARAPKARRLWPKGTPTELYAGCGLELSARPRGKALIHLSSCTGLRGFRLRKRGNWEEVIVVPPSRQIIQKMKQQLVKLEQELVTQKKQYEPLKRSVDRQRQEIITLRKAIRSTRDPTERRRLRRTLTTRLRQRRVLVKRYRKLRRRLRINPRLRRSLKRQLRRLERNKLPVTPTLVFRGWYKLPEGGYGCGGYGWGRLVRPRPRQNQFLLRDLPVYAKPSTTAQPIGVLKRGAYYRQKGFLMQRLAPPNQAFAKVLFPGNLTLYVPYNPRYVRRAR